MHVATMEDEALLLLLRCDCECFSVSLLLRLVGSRLCLAFLSMSFECVASWCVIPPAVGTPPGNYVQHGPPETGRQAGRRGSRALSPRLVECEEIRMRRTPNPTRPSGVSDRSH